MKFDLYVIAKHPHHAQYFYRTWMKAYSVQAEASVTTMGLLALPSYESCFLAILVCTPLFILFHIRRRTISQKSRLPPSPRGLPIIGNLHQLGSLPHQSLRALAGKHGPLMLLRLGHVPTLVVSSADAAQEIMRTHDLIFASRPSVKVGRILHYGCQDLIFSPYGEYWRQVRKICITHLLSNKMVQSFQRMREEEVAIMIDKVSSRAAASSAVDMSGVLNSFANDVICRVVSGKFSMEAGRNRVFQEMVEENSKLFGALVVEDFLPSLGWLDDVFFGVTARAERNRKRWDDVLDEVIRDHADGDRTGDGIQQGCFVDVLLSLQNNSDMDFALSKENIKALLLDMFGAATDTTSILLEWTMAEIARNPRVMKKLQDEVRGIAKGKTMVREEDLSKLSYLKGVLKEALRLHPPAPLLLPRESMEDCEIKGYKVPKQTRVLINYWAIGRDPKSWDASEEFQPERFIDNPVDFKGNHFQFIPFGAGRRICPGMNFALPTNELALANLMHRFNWELPGSMTIADIDMTEAPGMATRMKQRLDLVARPYIC